MCLKSVRNRMKSATVTLVTLTWHFAALCPLRLMFIRLVRSGVDVFLQRIGLTSQIGELLSLAKHRCWRFSFSHPGFLPQRCFSVLPGNGFLELHADVRTASTAEPFVTFVGSPAAAKGAPRARISLF